MNEEELRARVAVLEGENKTLTKDLDDLKADITAKAEKVEKETIEASTEEVAGKLPAGKRKEFVKRVEAKDSPAEKLAVLAETQALIDDGVIAELAPNKEILGTGVEGDTDTFDANADKREAHVVALQKDDPELDRVDAELKSTVLKPDLWKGMKE